MNWTLILREAAQSMTAAGVPDAMRDARVLLAHAMGVGLDRLSLHMHDTPLPDQIAAFRDLSAKRATRIPVSHLTGGRLFWGRRFAVSADVLDPRPETEILIEQALKAPFQRVLDLGTGSGAIFVTLLAENPQASGMAVDLSPAALAMARRNAEDLGVADRGEFRASDWFGAVEGAFDLIVSNPPYIGLEEMPFLSPEVYDHEPHMALTDGADGLTAYRQIAQGVGGFLTPEGRVLVEIGPTQGQAVAALFTAAGLRDVQIYADFDGRDRVVAAKSASTSPNFAC